MKLNFYIRVIGITAMFFPSLINKCLVFNGFKKPHIYNAKEIIGDLSFNEIRI